MKLTSKALRNMRQNRKIYTLIALELQMSEGNVRRIAASNLPNNDLTKLKSIQVIKKETGLQEKEIVSEK